MSALGASGAGHTAPFGGKDYVFVPWSQAIMDAFSEWLYRNVQENALETGERFRRKARKMFAEAKALRERGLDLAGTVGPDVAAQMQTEWEDMAGEAQALQMEAREMVSRIGDFKAIGGYHFYGRLATEARNEVNGRVKIAHLCLLPKQPGITIAELEVIAKKYWEPLGEALASANDDAKKPSASAVSTQPSPTTNSATTSTSGSDEAHATISN